MAMPLPDGSEPDMSFQEIGEVLGVSTQTVWKIYQGAIEKLRRDPSTARLLDLAECMRAESNQFVDTSV